MADYFLSIRTRTRVSGPLFDGRATRAMDEFADELEEEGAEWAHDHIIGTYHRSFKDPTPRYEFAVRVRKTRGGAEVWDGGQAGPVYGPWLEGVGSRNATTRFKGYWAFRKASEALDRRIAEMGDSLFRRSYRHRME